MTFLPKAAIAVLCLALLPAHAQKDDKKKDEPHPKLPVEQWLSGPERSDFKWRVELVPPRMTYQQRFLVQVRAYVDAAPLQAAGHSHDFYFLMKVADERGNWLPDDTYNHYPPPPGLDKSSEIQYSTGLYAKPGKYTAALILYDVVQGQGNLWRKQFEVKAPKKDPLPALDRDLPAIEFVTEVPSDALPTHERVSFTRDRRGVPTFTATPDIGEEEWPPGHGTEFLPVRAPRPLRVDFVLNFAPWIDPYMQRRTSTSMYRADSGRILQIGAVLSHLQIERGCVRVGAVDLSKLTVVFDRLDGRAANWDKITEQVRKIDHNTVSAAVLGNRKSTAGFLRDYLTDLMADASGCGPGSEKTDRVIVLVSHDFQFPAGTHGESLWPDVQCSSCRYYHLRIIGGGPGSSDDLEKFFKAANPRRFDVNSPEQFRKALAEMIEEFSGGRARAREAAQ